MVCVLPAKGGRTSIGVDGFQGRIGFTVLFFRERGGVVCAVHGDDFTFEGPGEGLKSLLRSLDSFGESKFGP